MLHAERKMNSKLEKILSNESVQATLKAAQDYCNFMEYVRLNKIIQVEFIDKLHSLLVALYQKAIQLPNIEIIIEADPEEIQLENQNPMLGDRLSEILKEFTDYSQSFDPLILFDKENFSQGWLVDDLSDIYKDLYRVLKKLEIKTDEYVQDALWSLKFGLGTHWGHHLIDALRFLHYIKYSHFAKHMD